MNEEGNVFELDIDDMMAEVERVLIDEGYDVREQVPAGVWWFRTDRGRDETTRDIVRALERALQESLRTIER